MGILNKIFGGSDAPKEEEKLPWVELNDLNQLDDIKQKSSTKTQVIFKHSTRCGISRMVKNQFESDFSFKENHMELYFLDLIAFRDVSNTISNLFQVVHQSPQLLVIKNGTVVAHDSHGAINDLDLSKYI
ncbi:bacillithiol system redox-active protein YtxJ [Flavisericum labens]|uniref:bacillithiol system redox-active protein YtxJ n=1 Tax=Flavisericum labens TaxID=3377112 RepID=UPI00387B10A6